MLSDRLKLVGILIVQLRQSTEMVVASESEQKQMWLITFNL